MTGPGPHLTPEREAEIRRAHKVCGTDETGPRCEVPLLLAALDAERAAHAQTRAALTGQAEKAIEDVRALRATLHAFACEPCATRTEGGCSRTACYPCRARRALDALGLVRPAPETT